MAEPGRRSLRFVPTDPEKDPKMVKYADGPTMEVEVEVGASAAIEARPDREDDIVERRLGEWRLNMTATVEGIKASVESA